MDDKGAIYFYLQKPPNTISLSLFSSFFLPSFFPLFLFILLL